MRLKSTNKRLSSTTFKDLIKPSTTCRTKGKAFNKLLSPRSKLEDLLKFERPKLVETVKDDSFKCYYDKTSRTYRKQWIGEIKLPKHDYYLIEPGREPPQFSCKSLRLPSLTPEFKLEAINVCHRKSLTLQSDLCAYQNDNRLEAMLVLDSYERKFSKEFIKACKSNDLGEIARLLLLDKNLINVKDKVKMTGLHWAALRGLPDLVQVLINAGGNVNAVDIVSFN